MKLLSRRAILAVMLTLICAHVIAAATLFESAFSDPNRLDDAVIITAIFISGIALLLRRQRNWRNELKQLHAKLSAEHALRLNAEKNLLKTGATLREAFVARDTIQIIERQRIARDIHDDLGQNLLALKIDLLLLSVTSNTFNRQLDLIRKNIDVTIRSLRTIINDLRPIALEDGLQNALHRQVDEFARINAIRCKLETDINVMQAASKNYLEATLFRILQESLSNISRHAQASEVSIALSVDVNQLSMTVHDNGVGMPAEDLQHGHGLLGIRDRINALKGSFGIESKPGQGTSLTLSIPIGK